MEMVCEVILPVDNMVAVKLFIASSPLLKSTAVSRGVEALGGGMVNFS